MHQTTPNSLNMIKRRKTGRDQMCAFRDPICIGILGLFSIQAASACNSSISGPASIPLDVVFENPQEKIEEGVRLAPPENKWDGYGEAIDVRGDMLVIGASEWNPCGNGSAYVYRSSDGAWQEEAQLTAGDRDDFIQQARRFEGQRFGTSVAVGDGIIAIGAPGNASPIAGGYTGAVYLFEYDGGSWVEMAKLTPDSLDQEPGQKEVRPADCSRLRPRSFGALVAMDGDTLAVGGDAEGRVYIYQRSENGWQEQESLPIPVPLGRDLYMASLDLFGDALALSAFYVPPQPEPAEFLTGRVRIYVFERAGEAWEESFQFNPDDREVDFLFLREVNVGASVALGGSFEQANLLVVGLPGFPDWSGIQDRIGMFGVSPENPEIPESHHKTGAVYIFEREEAGDWNKQAILQPAGWEDPPGPGSLFAGVSTAMDDEQGVIDEATFNASVVFPGDVFSEDPEISFFGATVDLDGNRLAVTAGFANATLVFEHQGQDWVYRFSLTPSPDGEMWEDYAQVVAISGDTLLLGTPGEFGNSAYVFDLNTAQ